MTTTQKQDTSEMADVNYVSNQEDQHRSLEGVKPESYSAAHQSTATLKASIDVQKPLEIQESQVIIETEPPQTLDKKINPKIPGMTQSFNNQSQIGESVATVNNVMQTKEMAAETIHASVTESLSSSINAQQQQKIMLESLSKGDYTTRVNNRQNIQQDLDSIRVSQAVKSEFSSVQDFAQTMKNPNTSFDLNLSGRKSNQNASESARAKLNTSGNLNSSVQPIQKSQRTHKISAVSQVQDQIESRASETHMSLRQSLIQDSVDLDISKNPKKSEPSIRDQIEPSESPRISQRDKESVHQTEQNYTEVQVSADTQQKGRQNNSLQITGSISVKQEETHISKQKKSYVSAEDMNVQATLNPEFDPEDFMALQGNKDAADTKRWAQKIFSCVDVDGSGYIEKDEMRSMLQAFFYYITKDDQDPEEINRELDLAMDEMDDNGDGLISFEEFLGYHLKMNGLANAPQNQEVKIKSKDFKKVQDSQEYPSRKNSEIVKNKTDIAQQKEIQASQESTQSKKQAKVKEMRASQESTQSQKQAQVKEMRASQESTQSQKQAKVKEIRASQDSAQSRKSAKVDQIIQKVEAPSMFLPKSEQILFEVQKQEEQEFLESRKHELQIQKQFFSQSKPSQSPKLDRQQKIVQIKIKSNNKLKFQFTNYNKVSSEERAKTIEQTQQCSQLGSRQSNKASLSDAANRKIKFLKQNLKHTADRLRSLQNKSVIPVDYSDMGSIFQPWEKNSQIGIKIEKVTLQSKKNRDFIQSIDKRPFSMENGTRKKIMRQQDANERAEQLNDSMHQKVNSDTNVARNKFTNYELEYSGLTKAEIEALPVQELYKRMNRNLRGMNKQTIQERCADRQQARYRVGEISPPTPFEEQINITTEQIKSVLPSAELRNWGFYQNQYEEDMILAQSDISYGKKRVNSNFGDRTDTAGGFRNTQTAYTETRGRRIKEILNYVKEVQKHNQNQFTQRSENNQMILNAQEKKRNETITVYDQEFDDGKLLDDFLKEQDRRVDFGKTQLYNKIRSGNQSQILQQNVLTSEKVEELLAYLKKENRVTDEFDEDYLKQTRIKIMSTLRQIMLEIGLAQRFQQMLQQEHGEAVTLERLRILTGRARKVYRASQDLSYIYKMIMLFEQDYRALSNKITKIRGVITNQERESIRIEAVKLKQLLVQLVFSIRQLLRSYKFFNEGFVFNDQDYLKHVANEMKEIKLQLSYLKVPFS